MQRKNTKKTTDELLIETATRVKLMDQRLFGGDGQAGELSYFSGELKALSNKIDSHKQEILDCIDGKKTATDDDIKAVNTRVDAVEKKMSWYAGGLASLVTAGSFLLGWIGLRKG